LKVRVRAAVFRAVQPVGPTAGAFMAEAFMAEGAAEVVGADTDKAKG
jgi:hypothetical protein